VGSFSFRCPSFDGQNEDDLFKLHGSLSWRKDKNTGQPVRVVTEEQPIPESKVFGENLLLYPASKIPPVKEPFGTLYGYFTKKLFAVRNCIAIGFSFRDPYFNAVFVDFLRRSKDNILCMISPSPDESELFQTASAEEIPSSVYQQIVMRKARFEDPDTRNDLQPNESFLDQVSHR
jgi:hypothetical protein